MCSGGRFRRFAFFHTPGDPCLKCAMSEIDATATIDDDESITITLDLPDEVDPTTALDSVTIAH